MDSSGVGAGSRPFVRKGGTTTDTPERKARRIIDANLEAAGWVVQSHDNLDLTAGSGIAVCELPMRSGFGTADYVLSR